ncbi:MAG: SDR family oxidoreductase, partial [Chloroflexi bacterium]|nr:SDR family oxidoreductase [Chloroflexota bacterium]
MNRFDVAGRVTVVTGAGSGIGRALCLAFAEAGAPVAALDVAEDAARATADLVQAGGGQALALGCDVRSPDQVAAAFSAVDRAFGGVDVLVNNAGIASHTLPEHLGLEEWHNVLDVNLTGAFLCAQQAGRRMIAQGRGSIINISSIGGASGVGRGNFVYDISKAALLQLTRELAVEWARYTIRVNAILPCQVR